MQRRWSRRHMTQSPPSTKAAAEAHASEPRDDDAIQARHDERFRVAWADLQRRSDHGDARTRDFMANCLEISDLLYAGEQAQAELAERQSRTPPSPPPDGLKTAAQAAAKLGCSIKTLNGHVDAGELRYVIIGHGKKRPRRMYADADLDEFITAQTRKDSPCPSDATRGRRSGSTTSESEIIAFSEVRKR